ADGFRCCGSRACRLRRCRTLALGTAKEIFASDESVMSAPDEPFLIEDRPAIDPDPPYSTQRPQQPARFQGSPAGSKSQDSCALHSTGNAASAPQASSPRLPPTQDRLNDVRRPQRQPQHATPPQYLLIFSVAAITATGRGGPFRSALR